MKNNKNTMILNGVDIGISKIELNKSDLIVIDKSSRYCLHVYVGYNWKDINSIEIGERRDIEFNEYVLSLNNEPALIWPDRCYVEKIRDDYLCFNLEFDDLETAHYMNKKGCFDIELESLEVRVFIDYRDTDGKSIIYDYKEKRGE